MYVPISPCLVAREAFLPADAMPRLRSTTSPSSRSPLASTRALLHSIIPAPVRSRSALTSDAVISAIIFFWFLSPGTSQPAPGIRLVYSTVTPHADAHADSPRGHV